MGQGVAKGDLEKLADAKLRDAQILFNNERWANSYYLAGYALELALKACVAKQFQAETIPDRKFVIAIHTHQYAALIGLAGLTAELRAKQDMDSDFAANWAIAAEWTPEARYESTDKSSANFLLHAITDLNHGVLPWIKMFW
jgi:HEPN domain-containing protein